MHQGHFESGLSVTLMHFKRRPKGRLIALVGISGFEPEQTEPKSVVLPLHHIPIPFAKIPLFCVSASENAIKSPICLFFINRLRTFVVLDFSETNINNLIKLNYHEKDFQICSNGFCCCSTLCVMRE